MVNSEISFSDSILELYESVHAIVFLLGKCGILPNTMNCREVRCSLIPKEIEITGGRSENKNEHDRGNPELQFM